MPQGKTHRMPKDADSFMIHWEMLVDVAAQLLRDVVVHVVVLGPRVLCGIEVEPSTGTKVIAVILSRELKPS